MPISLQDSVLTEYGSVQASKSVFFKLHPPMTAQEVRKGSAWNQKTPARTRTFIINMWRANINSTDNVNAVLLTCLSRYKTQYWQTKTRLKCKKWSFFLWKAVPITHVASQKESARQWRGLGSSFFFFMFQCACFQSCSIAACSFFLFVAAVYVSAHVVTF
jgi:hypothetical protein